MVSFDDVALHQASPDEPQGHSRHGLDTNSRMELMALRTGIAAIRTKDRVAHQLLIRDIGQPCTLRIHGSEPGHCHRIPRYRLPLIAEMDYREIDARLETAIQWLMSIAGEEPHHAKPGG